MAQHDYSIANQTFPATRGDINDALDAIKTTNSGTSAPSTQFAGQFWLDTNTPSGTTWTLYFHDGTDDITFATIDTSANTVNFSDSAPITALNNPTANELVTVGSTTTELDAETNLTFDGTTLAVTGTVEPSGDTASGDNAAIGYTAAEGLILTGQGSTSDVTIKNDADATVLSIPTGTTDVTVAGSLTKTGDLTVDVSGTITLDAGDTGEIRLKDSGTQYGLLRDDDSRLKIHGTISDKDIMIVGNDGGVETTAVNFDMSEGGRARFYGGVSLGGNGAANTLDDYEEGTFTPVLNGDSSFISGVTHTIRFGSYTKIGNQVTVHIYIDLTSVVDMPTGNCIISTLPFTSSSSANYSSGVSIGYTKNWDEAPVAGTITDSSTYIYLRKHSSTSALTDYDTNVDCGDMNGNSEIILTATYETD